jgi:chromosome segregation ATPase
MPKTSKSSLPLRPDKTIDWLSTSRDDWKEKTLATKAELKVAKQAQKRAQVSRKQWKEHCKELKEGQAQQEAMLKKKENEIAELEAKIIHLKQENEELKKKYWSAQRTRG